MTKLGLPKGFRGNKRKYSLPKRINGYLVLRTEEVSYFVRGGGGRGEGAEEWMDRWMDACMLNAWMDV